jgi:hypothetical protein
MIKSSFYICMLVTHKVRFFGLALSQKDSYCELASNMGTKVKTSKVFFRLFLNIMNIFPPTFWASIYQCLSHPTYNVSYYHIPMTNMKNWTMLCECLCKCHHLGQLKEVISSHYLLWGHLYPMHRASPSMPSYLGLQ